MANKMYDRNKPKYAWGDSWEKNGVTEAQARFLESLSGKTGVKLINTETMTRGTASGLINELQRYSPIEFCNEYLRKHYGKFVEV